MLSAADMLALVPANPPSPAEVAEIQALIETAAVAGASTVSLERVTLLRTADGQSRLELLLAAFPVTGSGTPWIGTMNDTLSVDLTTHPLRGAPAADPAELAALDAAMQAEAAAGRRVVAVSLEGHNEGGAAGYKAGSGLAVQANRAHPTKGDSWTVYLNAIKATVEALGYSATLTGSGKALVVRW